MSGKEKGYRIRYTLGKGKRGEITLSSKTAPTVAAEFTRLVLALADFHREGARLTLRDKQSIEILPTALREKLISHNLIEGKPDEVIPTLGVFLKKYFASRPDKSQSMHKRIQNYLTEYFGENKRIDLITPVEAAGIKQYLMNERKKPKGKRGGCLSETTIDRAVVSFKNCFKTAVDWGYLKVSPFANVKGGKTSNRKRRHYVTPYEFQQALNSVEKVELKIIFVFARYAGLRIPSEIQDLKFSNFKFEENGDASFDISPLGKTGERVVPLFDELRPYFDILLKFAKPNQEYLFPKYRLCKGIGTLIRKRMAKAGLPIWTQFFTNCRRSCMKDKLEQGFTEREMTLVFGNTQDVRNEYYYFETERRKVAALARRQAAEAAENVPPDFPPSYSDDLVFPPDSPSFRISFWDEFNDDTPDEEVAFRLLCRQGWSHEKAHAHLLRAKDMSSFGKYVKSMREKVNAYRKGRISQWQFLPGAVIFAARLLWEHIKEIVYLPTEAGKYMEGQWLDELTEWRGDFLYSIPPCRFLLPFGERGCVMNDLLPKTK
jgi:integrase